MLPSSPTEDLPLSRIERLALRFAKRSNESSLVLTEADRHLGLANRMLVEGLEDAKALDPERGVMLVSNHRSFFDQYAMLLGVYMGPVHWAKRLFFPVRSNFFYDQPLGIVVNAAIAGGAMYPPIFRQAERRALNDEALDKMVELLQRPGNVLGMHPEGTRGKGPDPYKFLPAQPGVGKLALVGKPTVVPAFIHGLGNNVVQDVAQNFGKLAKRDNAVITVFGKPVDYTDLLAEKPRPTLYKKAADRFRAEVGKLALVEKELRRQLAAGTLSDDDPRWLNNRPISKIYAAEAQR